MIVMKGGREINSDGTEFNPKPGKYNYPGCYPNPSPDGSVPTKKSYIRGPSLLMRFQFFLEMLFTPKSKDVYKSQESVKVVKSDEPSESDK